MQKHFFLWFGVWPSKGFPTLISTVQLCFKLGAVLVLTIFIQTSWCCSKIKNIAKRYSSLLRTHEIYTRFFLSVKLKNKSHNVSWKRLLEKYSGNATSNQSSKILEQTRTSTYSVQCCNNSKYLSHNGNVKLEILSTICWRFKWTYLTDDTM
jgi:hypothetical protein